MSSKILAAALAALLVAAPAAASAAVIQLASTLDLTQPNFGAPGLLLYEGEPAFGPTSALELGERDVLDWTIDFLGDQRLTATGLDAVTAILLTSANPANLSSNVVMTGELEFLGAAGETLFTSSALTNVDGVYHVGQAFGAADLAGLPNVVSFYGLRYVGGVDDYLNPLVQWRTYDGPSLAFEADSLRLQSAVPEPGTWALMILGFAAVGSALRRRSAAPA